MGNEKINVVSCTILGFGGWHMGNQNQDEVFLAAQEAVGAHRDSQGRIYDPLQSTPLLNAISVEIFTALIFDKLCIIFSCNMVVAKNSFQLFD